MKQKSILQKGMIVKNIWKSKNTYINIAFINALRTLPPSCSTLNIIATILKYTLWPIGILVEFQTIVIYSLKDKKNAESPVTKSAKIVISRMLTQSFIYFVFFWCFFIYRKYALLFFLHSDSNLGNQINLQFTNIVEILMFDREF